MVARKSSKSAKPGSSQNPLPRFSVYQKQREAEEAAKAETARAQRLEANARRRARAAEKRAEAERQKKASSPAPSRVRQVESVGLKTPSMGAKASPSKVRLARENLTEAFDLMGGVPALVKWGKGNPTEFYRIWSKLLPKEAVDEGTAMPLENLLAKLAERSEQSVTQAAQEIGQEILDEAGRKVMLEDAMKVYSPSLSDKVTVQ